MQKHVNLVDLVKSFPTNIFLQDLASILRRTSPIKFAHLAEKSENDSISNLSTKAPARAGQCAAESPSTSYHRKLPTFGEIRSLEVSFLAKTIHHYDKMIRSRTTIH